VVVATGGGALASADALALARDAGRVVYLRASVPELVSRLEGRVGRPLLSDAAGAPLSRDALRERLEDLLAERENSYMEAHHVVEAAGRPAAAVALEIAGLVSRA
jgi:shikimate kinase